MEKEAILTDIISTQSLPDYEAADVLWTTLTTVVNVTKEDGKSTSEQDPKGLESLLEKFSEDEMKRLLKVKRYSKQVINNIIKVQTSQSKRLKYADYIVDNNKSLSELNGQVKGIVSELK